MSALEPALARIWAFAPQLLFFQSGVDGLTGDRLGRLSLTHNGLARRDAMVIQQANSLAIPLVITLGGGYAEPIDITVTAHAQTFIEAAEVYCGSASAQAAIRSSCHTRSMATLVTVQDSPEAFNSPQLQAKQDTLSRTLRELRRVIVAYSGGTDSAYLAWAAHQVLADDAIAITADSASIPTSHKRDAEAFARECGFRHEYIETHEFANPDYVKNDKERCFHCKDELFLELEQYARQHGYEHIVYGVNKDDLSDYRPGQRAAKLHEVKAPLVESGLNKAEIRELSRRAGLSTWDRPAAACLSSRVPYGTPVSIETIKTIETGEEAIRALGFRQFRVRFHGQLARIEIARDELSNALNLETVDALTKIFKQLGFVYVTLDLEGYRQGSLNAVLSPRTPSQ